MATIVGLQELQEHAPEVRDGLIVGCSGCQWTSVIWRASGTQWEQYLHHLPTFQIDGALVLSDPDVRMLIDIDMAFLGPVKEAKE